MRPAPFLKMEGAGNDFILLDLRRFAEDAKPSLTRAVIRGWCDRHRGLGADGLLCLDKGSRGGKAKVRYWNADGGKAPFCGNGARCVGLVLLGESGRGNEVRFCFGRQEYVASRHGLRGVEVLMPMPRPLAPDSFPPRRTFKGAWIDSGVPHFLLRVPDVATADLPSLARTLRRHPAFGRGGTNVDLVEVRPREILVRTWERGVEGETLACGSGLLAVGFWAHTTLGRRFPIRVRSRGGDRFMIRQDEEGRGLWLSGPARIVYRAVLATPGAMR